MTTPEESFEARLAPVGDAPPEPRLKFRWRRAAIIRRPLSFAAWLRSRIRASELLLVVVAVGVGAGAGVLSALVSFLAHSLQAVLFGLPPGQRLSAIDHLAPWRALALPAGGLVLGLVTWAWTRRRAKAPVDPVEANALHGGRMSVRDSLFVGVQSIVSNGFGASVGLEAAYAQLGAGLGSRVGQALRLRRSDLRAFVGAGAGAGIAAAFGAPLTGAFYAFEIIIGSYTVVNIAAVVAAAIAATWASRALAIQPTVLHTSISDSLTAAHYLLFAGVGVVSAVIGVAIMRLVAFTEHRVSALPGPRPLKLAVGGAILAALALIDPHSLSAGHGAMGVEAAAAIPLAVLGFLILAKASASIIALGFGFRGGLFFASLYLGALVGKFLVVAADAAGFHTGIDPTASALVGMGAMAVAIIGGPFTMTFLVLETTGDFAMTAATLTASIIASLLVRETFGYSFSTWRLHLRGETIRSANDVSWLRSLTAARIMRADARMIGADTPSEAFRARFPLGSTRWVVGLDALGHYAGLIRVATAHAVEDPAAPVGEVMINRREWLRPDMAIKEIMGVFDRTESDELAVLSEDREVLGVVSEAYATRRYAEELEKARSELVGGD
ncbi:MAG TPA: chloride channel protein [Caulobacteraceae bacterium]|nr:chloride channel protein [Caulobacteraceae bacterium]